MMITGIVVAIIWNIGLNLSSAIYEVFPGMAAGFIVYGIANFLIKPQNLSQEENL